MDKIILFIVIFLIFLGYLNFAKGDVVFVKGKNNEYHLVRNKEDKEQSALLLSQLKDRLDNLVNYLVKKYKGTENHEKVMRLRRQFSKNNIQESSASSQYTSYSINKGQELHFCLRSKNEKESLHDINTLMFVAIHELAHAMSVSFGHNKEFLENFKFLLKEAIEINVYTKVDYNINNKEFCGIQITNTPLH